MIDTFIVGICTGMNTVWVMEDIKTSKYSKWTAISSVLVIAGLVSAVL